MNVSTGAKSATLGAIFAAVLIGGACFFVAIGLGYVQDLDVVAAQGLSAQGVELVNIGAVPIIQDRLYSFTAKHDNGKEEEQLDQILRVAGRKYNILRWQTTNRDVEIEGRFINVPHHIVIHVELRTKIPPK